MRAKERREIPRGKLFVVTSNTKKIDFDKKFNFLYFDWWFQLIDMPVLIFLWVVAALFALYMGLRVTHREHMQILRQRGCILVSNHCHYFDTVFAGFVLFPMHLYISVAQRNFEVPIVRRLLRLVRGFPIPARKDGFEKIRMSVGEALRRGHHVLFLPEGDLVFLSQEIYRFRSGAFRMAYLNQAPILPMVYVLRPRRIFGRKQSPNWPQMQLVFGEPIMPPPLTQDGTLPMEAIHVMMDRVADWMEETIATYQAKALPQAATGDQVDAAC